MATVKKVSKTSKIKKYQSGGDTTKNDPDIQPWMAKFNAQTRAEMKNPKLAEERRRKEDSTTRANFLRGRAEDRARYIKEGYKVEDRPSGSTVYTKPGSKAKDGKWMQKAAASIKKRGTAGKCTPITKKSCTGKAKVLAKTFKKIAAKRKSK